VCQIASYIEKGAFYCFLAGDLFWDFAVALSATTCQKSILVRQNLMKPGKNYYKQNITTAGTWWHADNTHKTFKLYDLYCDLG